MRKMYFCFSLLCYFICSGAVWAQGLSGTLTVGPNAADYPTFQAMVTALQQEGVAQGGVTFTIQPGVYQERFVLQNITGLNEDSRLTIFAEPGTVTFEAVGTSANNDAFIRVNALSFVTIDGLTLVDNSTPGTEIEYGLFFQGTAAQGCRNNIIRNTSITLGASGARPIIATRGVFFSSAATSVDASNSNNVIDNISVDNASWGIQFRCAANFLGQITQPDFNNQVINSTFGANLSLGHDLSSGALAINALGGRNMIISNNLIESVENFNSSPALPVVTSGISLDSCSGVVSGNIINNIEYQGTNGSVIGIRTSTFAGDTTLIYNNKISGLTRSNFTASTTDPSFTIQGIWIFSQGNNNGLARVFHNSIYLDSEQPVTYSSSGVHLSGGSTGQFPGEVFNNIIVNRISTSTTPYKSYALVDGNTTRGFLISNHNLLFADGDNGYLGGIGRELGGTEQFSNDLQTFVTFSQTNADSANFLPEFADAPTGDLSFEASITPNDGYFAPALAEVPFDILGITRAAPLTFKGAFEGPEALSVPTLNETQMVLYPNPTQGELFIRSGRFTGAPISLEVYNQQGQVVMRAHDIAPVQEEISIDTAALSTGMYFIRLIDDNALMSQSFLVR